MKIDRELFLTLNALGSPFLDWAMIGLSDKYIWIPMYLYLIYRLYQKDKARFYLPLIILIILLSVTDQITATIMKPYFERLRPCKDPSLDGLVTVIGNSCRGLYGFASGHAANSFGLAAFFYFREHSKVGIALLIWAALVAYSRVYLGVHYPGDILIGSIIGVTCAWIISTLANKLFKNVIRAH